MRGSRSPSAFGQLRRVGIAALIAFSLGMVVIVVGQGGFSTITAVRVMEDIVLGVLGVGILACAAAFVAVRMAGWREGAPPRQPPRCACF